jgi:hypothetical protein
MNRIQMAVETLGKLGEFVGRTAHFLASGKLCGLRKI